MTEGLEIPDGNKAYKAAQRAFKTGRDFKTICEWCGWSGWASELLEYGEGDGFCPLCDAWCEWKLWDDV